MARRKKVSEVRDSDVTCYYCDANIPENAMRCPSCGKFFSATKKMITFGVVLILITAGLGYVMYDYFTGSDHEGYENGNGPPPNGNTGNRYVNIVTSLGTMKVEMYEDTAPITAGHFINLVTGGIYSTGANFYRAEPGFVIQGGLQSGSSQTVAWEDNGLQNTKYTISMARSGDPNNQADSGTGSSEFFINLEDNTNRLNDPYTYDYVVFGKVISGTNLVDQIAGLPTSSQGGIMIINDPITIQSMSITES